jgi:hypothetical protein
MYSINVHYTMLFVYIYNKNLAASYLEPIITRINSEIPKSITAKNTATNTTVVITVIV